MNTVHRPVVSPSLDHSPHCSYLGSHYTLVCVCPFVCVRLRIRVKVCADMVLSVGAWVLSEGASETVLLSAKKSIESACCLHACQVFYEYMLLYGCYLPVNETKRHPSAWTCKKTFQSEMPLSLLTLSDGAAPMTSCWHCFYLWRQDVGSGVPLWPLASTTSHVSPSTSCSRNPGCQLPLTDALNSWFVEEAEATTVGPDGSKYSRFSLITSPDH